MEKGPSKDKNDDTGRDKDMKDENIFNEINNIVPGLGRLIEDSQKILAFNERTEEANQEVKEYLNRGLRLRIGKKNEESEEDFTKREPAAREIYVDIFNEENFYKIVAEIPHIKEEDIEINFKENLLVLNADTKERKYHKSIKIPENSSKDFSKSYKNGVLELVFRKKRGNKPCI